VSPSEVADGGEAETHVGTDGLLQPAEDRQGSVPARGNARRPTGDDAVDQVLGRFDGVTDEPLETQIDVGEQVLQVLQGRLADLGKE
jgi:hypothetical protein